MAEEQKTGCSPSDCAGCSHAGECGSKPQSLIKPENKKSHINHVIAVVSGKGGVGKSMVTATLANRMAEKGFRVGILDADILRKPCIQRIGNPLCRHARRCIKNRHISICMHA